MNLRYLLLLLLFPVSIQCHSQMVSINAFLAFADKDIYAIEDYLTLHQWQFIKKENSESGIIDSYAYQLNEDDTNKAKGWMHLFYKEFSAQKNDGSNENIRIVTCYSYTLTDKPTFLKSLSLVKQLGYKLSETKSDYNQHKRIYKKGARILQISEQQIDGKSQYHYVVII